jgi:hypothetical protein
VRERKRDDVVDVVVDVAFAAEVGMSLGLRKTPTF